MLIGKFEGVVEVMGCIGGLIYLLEVICILIIIFLDFKEKLGIVMVIVKYYMMEIVCIILNDVMDIYFGCVI